MKCRRPSLLAVVWFCHFKMNLLYKASHKRRCFELILWGTETTLNGIVFQLCCCRWWCAAWMCRPARARQLRAHSLRPTLLQLVLLKFLLCQLHQTLAEERQVRTAGLKPQRVWELWEGWERERNILTLNFCSRQNDSKHSFASRLCQISTS